jgi:phospholipid/cholesterol/gamma-HCH transport system substrate-binding protein
MSSTTKHLAQLRPTSQKAVGVAVLVGLLAFSVMAFNRPRVETALATGEALNAEFSQSYKLVPYQSTVKLAGVQVGKVTGVERIEGHAARVEMELEDGTLEKLGSDPSANVRPTLVLGGNYYVELVRGGRTGSAAEDATIPVARTSVPVELDKVLSTITPSASKAVRGTIASLEGTFGPQGQRRVQELVTTAPPTLRRTTDLLTAAQGTDPADLTVLVSSLQNTAAAFTKDRSQLASILDDLATTTRGLASQRGAIANALSDAPVTLDATRTGLTELDGTLDKLETTASSFRPSARALEPVLAELDAVLRVARPVMADARVVARDARPTVEDLVPTSVRATDILQDIRGPVLNRLNGPLKAAVLDPWHGTGVYEGGGNDHTMYEELGYLLSDTADVFKFHDKNGAHGRLMAGIGLSTPGGILGMSFEEYLETLGYQLPAGPQEGANQGEPAPPLGSSPSSGNGSGPTTSSPQKALAPLELPLVSRSNR